MAEVLEVTRKESLDQYRLVWRLLAAQSRWPTFQHTLDWFESHWRGAGNRQSPRILVVRAAGEVVGIVPLVLCHEPIGRRVFRVMQFPVDASGSSVGPIGPNPTATLMGAMRYLNERRSNWDMLRLSATTIHPGMASRIQTSLALAPLSFRQQRSFAATLIELAPRPTKVCSEFHCEFTDVQNDPTEIVRVCADRQVVAEGQVQRWLGGAVYQRFVFSNPLAQPELRRDAIATLLNHHSDSGDRWLTLPIDSALAPKDWTTRAVEHVTFTCINRRSIAARIGRLLSANRFTLRRAVFQK